MRLSFGFELPMIPKFLRTGSSFSAGKTLPFIDEKVSTKPAAGQSVDTAAQVVRSEIRAFVLSKKGDPEFTNELRGLVETDLRYATALLEAPAALSGVSNERLDTLRLHAAAALAPEATERLSVAAEVAGLDAKLAKVAAEVPRSFYDANIEKGMASHVDINSPLGGE